MSLLSKVTAKAPALPSRVYMYAQEKFGKTSWATHAPSPIFVMTEGETGLLSLLESGRVPETPHFPEDCKTWGELFSNCQAVLNEPHDYKTLVLDTSNGAERLLANYVLESDFQGMMSGKNGFASYGKGHEACIPHWTRFLQLLDQIRTKRKMLIVLLAHAKIKSVNNPEGEDYDQIRPEGIDKLWTLTHKWADAIIAGTYQLTVKDDKVRGGGARQLRTTPSHAVVAGNRYGLPDVIQCGGDAKSAWANFQAAVVKAKAAGRAPASPPPPASPPASPPPAAANTPTAPTQKQIDGELDRTGWTWPRVIAAINENHGEEYPDSTKLADLDAHYIAGFFAWLQKEPSKPKAAPASADNRTSEGEQSHPKPTEATPAATTTTEPPKATSTDAPAAAPLISSQQAANVLRLCHELERPWTGIRNEYSPVLGPWPTGMTPGQLTVPQYESLAVILEDLVTAKNARKRGPKQQAVAA
jgi:hypothetical protein